MIVYLPLEEPINLAPEIATQRFHTPGIGGGGGSSAIPIAIDGLLGMGGDDGVSDIFHCSSCSGW